MVGFIDNEYESYIGEDLEIYNGDFTTRIVGYNEESNSLIGIVPEGLVGWGYEDLDDEDYIDLEIEGFNPEYSMLMYISLPE